MEDSRAAKAAVHNSIVDALIRFMPESVAKEVTRAIAKAEIPHLAIQYVGGAR